MANPIDLLSAKIAFLGLVNDLPERPSANESSPYEVEEPAPGRTLSFRHEISITQHLAFICAYSGDPLHVMATCVEEVIPKGGLVIRFAANTGKHQVLVDALNAMSEILQNEALDVNRSMNHDALFRIVVALNRMRILSRIRSRHAPTFRMKNKAPLLRRLQTAQELLHYSSVCESRVLSFASAVNSLQQVSNDLEAMGSLNPRSSSERHILELVESTHSILLEYEDDLKLIPDTPGIWTGNATEALIERLRKTSHYVKACHDLLRAARRYKIFSRMAVEFVDLQQHGMRLSSEAVPCIAKVIQASITEETLSKVSSRRQKSVLETQEDIRARLSGNSRLHAEIQLALYYEQDARLLRPRVLCSSKSACYLCHLLLEIHGQYYIPSTHGRLYETWRWPAPAQLPGITSRRRVNVDVQRLLPEFSNAIDSKIHECLTNTRPIRRMEPLESKVNLLAAITPSVLSYESRHSYGIHDGGTPHQELEGPVDASLANENHGYEPSDTNAKPVGELVPVARAPPPQIHMPVASPPVCADYRAFCDKTATPTIRGHASDDTLTPSFREVRHPDSALQMRSQDIDELQSVPLCLQTGECARHSSDQENGLLLVHVPGLHVSVEYDTSPCRGNQEEGKIPQAQGKPFQIEVQRLSSSHGSGNGLSHVVDLEEGDWVEKPIQEGVLFSTEGLLLRRGSTLLRLRARPSVM